MPKMKRPPLIDIDDWENGQNSVEGNTGNGMTFFHKCQNGCLGTNATGGDDLDEDVAEFLNEKEAELRSYLLFGEALSEEVLLENICKLWNTDPYK